MSITKFSDKVYAIDTKAFGYEQCVASYLIKGEKYALVDVGYASTYHNILDSLYDANINLNDIKYIIPTHVHLDHSGATGHLIEYMKNATVVAHERAAKHLIDPTRLVESSVQVFGHYEVYNRMGLPMPVNKDRIEIVKDELELDLGGITLKCIYAPGHAPHQISVYIEELNYLLTADTVGIIYPFLNAMIPTTPPPSFNAEQAIETLNKLSTFKPKVLLIPHFGIRMDYQYVFEETKRKINDYIETVSKMRNQNYSYEEMLKGLIKKLSNEANINENEIHPYAIHSLKVSLSGILTYLSKK